MPTRKVAVIAIGGNSLILSKDAQTVQDQYRALCVTGKHIVSLVELGYQVVVTYGNGPQVGFLLWRSEVAHATSGLHGLPLVTCVADTQGGIGYQIQQTLKNEFLRRGLCEDSIAVLTQVVVDKNDPGFRNPTKPVGEFYPPERAEVLRRENPSWVLREDAGRGFRRYVPSPRPLEIVEEAGLKTLLASGLHLIAGGGGGIPVFRTEGGYEGVDAVVDKDLDLLPARQTHQERLVRHFHGGVQCRHPFRNARAGKYFPDDRGGGDGLRGSRVLRSRQYASQGLGGGGLRQGNRQGGHHHLAGKRPRRGRGRQGDAYRPLIGPQSSGRTAYLPRLARFGNAPEGFMRRKNGKGLRR